MGDLHLLIPKLPVTLTTALGLTGSTIYGVSYNDTIGLGSIVVAAIVVIVAGVFTLRNNLKTFWKDLATERGEQVKVLEEDLKERAQQLVDAQLHHTEEMASFAEEQREVRHQLKTDVATLEGRLKLEEAKHDLSAVIGRLDGLEHTIDSRAGMFEQMVAGITHQSGLLKEIRDQLAARPSTEGHP
jgi:gas vesicle protein